MVTHPPRKTRFRLLVRLYRTGLVTRRVPSERFQASDYPPFPSFLARSVHFMTYKETMTAALFITFLERMLSETTRKIFLIVDRLRAHEAKKVEARVAEHRDRIELFFLPRYAPERNADEYLNNDMKGSINATGLPGSAEGLRQDPGVHDQVAAPAGACRQYFQQPSSSMLLVLNM